MSSYPNELTLTFTQKKLHECHLHTHFVKVLFLAFNFILTKMRLLLALVSTLNGSPVATESVTVTTDKGTLRGTSNTIEGVQVSSYLGVPFAQVLLSMPNLGNSSTDLATNQ